MEQKINYANIDIAQLKNDLRHALKEATDRGLLNTSKWIAEQLIGIRKIKSTHIQPEVSKDEHYSPTDEEAMDIYFFAKSLFDLKEYLRCAYHLSTIKTCTSKSLFYKITFLRLYATFLPVQAGEKRREEQTLEGDAGKNGVMENKEIKQIHLELKKLKQQNQLDSHLLYLYGVVLKEISMTNEAISHFIESINLNPYLWCSWEELLSLCTNKEIFREIKNKLTSPHWMKDLFIANCLLELQQCQEALNIYSQLCYIFPTSTYLQSQIALANYNLTEFIISQEQFEKILKQDPYRLEGMDTYSNILYVKEEKSKLSYLAHNAYATDKYRPETCCIVGNYYSRKGNHEKAIMYFKRALKLDKGYLSAWTLMGHEYVELKNTTAAVHAYRTAVDINPRDYRAWYGLGQTYEILQMPLYSLYYYSKAAALRQYDGRMWCALAGCYENMQNYKDALRCYERARQNNDPDGIAIQKMAQLHRVLGNDREAAECFIQMLEDRENEGIELDQQDAKALLFLAHYFKDQNQTEEAQKYCFRLLDYNGPEKEQAKSLLKELRTRLHFEDSSFVESNPIPTSPFMDSNKFLPQ